MIMENDMNITTAQYNAGIDGSNSTIQATIDGQALSVPLDPANRHYEAILEWVADGNTIEAAE
tara:strand:+ start:367 stop:555 length:189 start_codon:yes stop_codon:yes gene_type:complete